MAAGKFANNMLVTFAEIIAWLCLPLAANAQDTLNPNAPPVQTIAGNYHFVTLAVAQDVSILPEEIPGSVTPPETETETQQDTPAETRREVRVVRGYRAKDGTVPWQVQIFSAQATYSEAEKIKDRGLPHGHKDKLYLDDREPHELAHKCGGSYIGDGWILTAAHCVPALNFALPGDKTGNLFRDRRIRMGTQNITAGGAVYEMERIVVHEGYLESTQVHDIALIKIKERGQTARLSGRLKAIPLHSPARPLYLNEDVWVTGWGWQAPRNPAMAGVMASASRLGVGNVIQHSPADLQEAKLKHISDANCRPHYPHWGPGMICIGAARTGRDSCQGDSGGPLVRQEGGAKVLVGIVSNGYGCAYKDIPAAYTRVSAYIDWIAKQKRTAPLGFSPRK